MEFVQGLGVGQLEPRYGSTTESDWDRAAMPAHAAPAALHRDCSLSASGNGPVPSDLRFAVRLGNAVVADRSQNPAARMESTQTPNCKRSLNFIARSDFSTTATLATSIAVCSCISGLLRTAFASLGPRSYTQAPRLVLSVWACSYQLAPMPDAKASVLFDHEQALTDLIL
jgi:hypothetical protein